MTSRVAARGFLRSLLPAIVWTAGVTAVAFCVIAVHVSNRIRNEALMAAYDHRPPWCDDAVVQAVGEATVTLKAAADDSSRVRRGPCWGLRWRDGWGEVGPVRGVSSVGVTRSLVVKEGKLTPGTPVDLTVELARSDPMRACHLQFQTVLIHTPLGAEPAWYVPQRGNTWAIFVHGKGADRIQALSTLGIYAGRALPCLVVSYRNDRRGPASPDGRYHYGLTEWEDLEAACEYGLAHGATGFVLVGFSMGGGVVLSFLERSRLASRVLGAVLDAPVTDFGATVDLGIRLARLPLIGAPLPPLTGALAKRLVSIRYGVDWREYALLRRADRIHSPLLVFHGDEDDVVPVEGSVALAAARPDLVTFERFPGARHLESRNLDRSRYEADVAAFLRSPSVLGP